MAQVPFTQDGVNQKIQELYQLSDADLLAQARAIAADISAWLDVNFTLSTRQKTYIGGAPDLVRFNWGAVIAAAVSARRPIDMDTPPGSYGPPRRTKQIIIDIIGILTYYPPLSGGGETSGTMAVSISYNLVD